MPELVSIRPRALLQPSSRRGRSCLGRMTCAGNGDPHRTPFVVDCVPDPPSTGHLKLPLLTRAAVNDLSGEVAG
jgi:hypothetical protein